MKEKIQFIILIVVFVGLLIFINNMLNETTDNTTNLSNVIAEKNIISDENMNLEENITIPEISSNNENTIENQISDDLEITNTNNENIANEAGKVIEVTETTFEEEVLKSDKTVLIDFYADWCGPCKILSPIIEEVAKENPDLKVVKIDVDKNESLAYEYRAYSIPTLVVIENGVEVNRAVGAIPKKDVLELIK